jgi:hypothetical protein
MAVFRLIDHLRRLVNPAAPSLRPAEPVAPLRTRARCTLAAQGGTISCKTCRCNSHQPPGDVRTTGTGSIVGNIA